MASSTFGSQSTTPLVARINELESQMLDGKLVLVSDDWKPLKPCISMILSSSIVPSKKVDDLVHEDNGSEVFEVYNENASFMASMGFKVNKAYKSGSRV